MRKRLCVAFSVVLCSGCINYSSYQDARIVERGHAQGTVAASLSRYEPHHDSNAATADDTDESWMAIQVDPRWGLGARCDAALHMSALIPTESPGSAWMVLGVDGRFAVIRNYFAITLPVSTTLSNFTWYSINVQPGVIMTLPMADQIDINASVRRSLFFSEDIETDGYWLVNAGLGIEVAPGWRIRPELGWMISDRYDHISGYYNGEPERSRSIYSEFGIGVSRSQ